MIYDSGTALVNHPLQGFFVDLRKSLDTEDRVHIVDDGAKVLPQQQSCTLGTKGINRLLRSSSEFLTSSRARSLRTTSPRISSKKHSIINRDEFASQTFLKRSISLDASPASYIAARANEKHPNGLCDIESTRLQPLTTTTDSLERHGPPKRSNDADPVESLFSIMAKFPRTALKGGRGSPTIQLEEQPNPLTNPSGITVPEGKLFSPEWWSQLDSILK